MSWSVTAMLPVPPPGAVSEPWYRMSRPSGWHGLGPTGIRLPMPKATRCEHLHGPYGLASGCGERVRLAVALFPRTAAGVVGAGPAAAPRLRAVPAVVAP